MDSDKLLNYTLAKRVTERLREDILTRQIEVGERITIKDIAERYGVSNMPVREAFRILEGESLLEMNAYKGATVKKLDKDFVCDVYGVLRALECAMYETCLDTIPDEVLEELRESNNEMRAVAREKVQPKLYNELNTNWHGVIISYCSNKLAEDRYKYYHQLITSIRTSAYLTSYERIIQATDEHDIILDALHSRDVLKLKTAVDTHSIGAMNDLLKSYSGE